MLYFWISDLVSIVANYGERNLCTSASVRWTCRTESGTSLNPLKKVLQLSKSQRIGICFYFLSSFFLCCGCVICPGFLPHSCDWLRWNFYECYNLTYSWANLEGMNNGICVLWKQIFISVLLLNKIQVSTYNQKCTKYSPHLLLINMRITICTTCISV